MDKPSSKRRRIDAATALSKPFKSPLRRPAPTNTEGTPSESVAPNTQEDTQVPESGTKPNSNPMSGPPDQATTPAPPKRKRILAMFSPFPLESWKTTDPEILEVQKQYREINSKVNTLIRELEMATQAHNLETNPRYIEIPTLITKWRLASQDAADEVFVDTKEKFNRLGGMAAWRERSKRDATRWNFDEENHEREHIDEYDGDVDNYGAEDSSDRPLNKNDGEEESQDEEFTMEFMLKVLHVDPKLIGCMSRPLKHKEIACARCFRHKRKCDHAKPSCGECRRKGAECLPARSRKTGDHITIPLEYLKQLENRLAELERVTETQTCDAGVQTDFEELDHSRNHPGNDTDYLMADQNSVGADNDGSLMLLSDLQHSSQRSPQTSPFSFSPDTFSLFPETTFDVPWIDLAPSYPLTDDDSPWLKELHTNVYFSVTHREWPFLNEAAWRSWHAEAILDGQEEWKSFFLQMVYAIGASLCNTLQRDRSHSVRSKEYYASAMRYYPYVVGHSSMVLQIQASLFMILYAMHSPSSEDITTIVSSVLPFCTAAMTEIRKHVSICGDNGSMTESSEVLTENMFITCYMLNEVIVSGWDRPVSAAYKVVDDDMCALGDTLQPTLSTNPAIRHLFRLRKIQARIRRSRENRARNPLARHGKGYNSSFKSALDRWRQEIPHHESDNDQHGFLHPTWMRKLYVYSLLILIDEKRDFIEMDGTEEILATIAEVCLNFRLLQEEGHVMCYTWSALVFQFRAGIMMLYIVWATTPITDIRDQQRIRQNTHQAIATCAANLAGFVDRWKDATPYMNVFEFIRQKIMWNAGTFEANSSAPISLEEAGLHLEDLKKKYLHRAVLGMIEDMMYGRRLPQSLLDDDFKEVL
ncbi:hypothetical protein N7534_004055 [Penicillium rubens]|nr:hypothetical protein N7534_004055 [Penicillium rubens]